MHKQKTITLLSTPNPSLAEAIELWAEINPSHRIKNLETLKAKLAHYHKIPLPVAKQSSTGETPFAPSEKQNAEKGKSRRGETPFAPSQSRGETPFAPSQYQNHPIELIVKKHSQLNATRSQLDIQRKALGIGNDQPTVKKRKALTKSINEMSNLIELLYITKENYYEKNIPIPDTVLHLIDDFDTPPDTEQSPHRSLSVVPVRRGGEAKTTPPVEQTQNTPMATQSKLETLQKELNSLLASQRRDNYQLEFQSTKKQTKPNPMPKTQKRFAIEKRMKERTKKINTTRNQIKSLKAAL